MFELCDLVFEVSDVLPGVCVVQLALHLPLLLLKRDKQQIPNNSIAKHKIQQHRCLEAVRPAPKKHTIQPIEKGLRSPRR